MVNYSIVAKGNIIYMDTKVVKIIPDYIYKLANTMLLNRVFDGGNARSMSAKLIK